MRTKGRGLTGLALAFVALAIVTDVQAQEAEAKGADEVVAIDATRGRDLDETQTVRVRIRNDLAPAGSVVVSVVTPTRPEYVLGAVSSNEVLEWEIDTRGYAGGFRLVARGPRGRTHVSRAINVLGQAKVRWNLGINLVRIERVEAEDEVS